MERKDNRGRGGNSPGAVYVIGLVGALVYYIQQAGGFWDTVLGILQALVWPAFLVYNVLKLVAA